MPPSLYFFPPISRLLPHPPVFPQKDAPAAFFRYDFVYTAQPLWMDGSCLVNSQVKKVKPSRRKPMWKFPKSRSRLAIRVYKAISSAILNPAGKKA